MSASSVIVLKFGGSILSSEADTHRIAAEIYAWRRQGFQVVAVVSAISGTTDRLSELANGSLAETDSYVVDEGAKACLLATGEVQSASLVGLALQKAGIPSEVASVASIGLLATGPRLDAELTCVNETHLKALLDRSGVVVVPGFIGNNQQDQTCLLGRGGSDLTALFIAAKLSAKCRLVKDVDGLYEFDPKQVGPTKPRRYSQITFADALQLDESIIQHKAIQFAERNQLPFEVTTWNCDEPTVVGANGSRWLEDVREKARPIRVALLGVGTVGVGVYQRLTQQHGEQFEVVAVACRDRRKALAASIHERLLVGDAMTAIDSECDVVIELVGGVDLPNQWVRRALQQGKHVVTANKSLLAADSEALQDLAADNEVTLSISAAVGGCVPALELVRHVHGSKEDVTEISAVLNGSCNFILGEIESGSTFDQALQRAAELGYTEADPHRDLAGIDAAEKLVLLAAECGHSIDADKVPRQPLNAETLAEFNSSDHKVLRQVASFTISDGMVFAKVEIQQLERGTVLANVIGAGNAICIRTANGIDFQHRGIGAGRWPTTTAVVADLLDLEKQIHADDAACSDRRPQETLVAV